MRSSFSPSLRICRYWIEMEHSGRTRNRFTVLCSERCLLSGFLGAQAPPCSFFGVPSRKKPAKCDSLFFAALRCRESRHFTAASLSALSWGVCTLAFYASSSGGPAAPARSCGLIFSTLNLAARSRRVWNNSSKGGGSPLIQRRGLILATTKDRR